MTYVFIHGLGQTVSSWDKVLAHLPLHIQIYSTLFICYCKR